MEDISFKEIPDEGTKEFDAFIARVLAGMTTKEKIELCSGKNFWHTKDFKKHGISSIMMTDGPHGLRKQIESADMLGLNASVPSTCFPPAVTSGSTWNRELLFEEGKAIAKEALANGVPVVLGPGMNIKRNPLCGRNFEYFSEDPVVSGEMGASFINGMQETGVACSMKHFAANNQEYLRFSSDSRIDERTLREIYLAGFERAVKKSSPRTVMCAYNKINGTACSDNRVLLTDILRNEWGFDGMVVTDWSAMCNRMNGFSAGCDLSMPGGSAYQEKETLDAVKKGNLSEKLIDESARRVLSLVFRSEKLLRKNKNASYDKEEHNNLAGKIAAEGMVLLKNSTGLLPLAEKDGILVVGHMAKDIRYQGSGSSRINPTKVMQFTDLHPEYDFEEAVDENGALIPESFTKALSKASCAKAVILFAGLPDSYESEGFDRSNMRLPESYTRLVNALAGANKNIILVLLGGGAMELPWIDMVPSVIYGGLGGQNAASAVSDIISGKICPSGKLTETWPLSFSDVPSSKTFAKEKDPCYREGIFVGYRYFDAAEKKVLFPFGFGLSYTSFEYKNLVVTGDSVTLTVRNTGNVEGSEVVQIYVEPETKGLFRAKKELRDFCKVHLLPGEEKDVSFEIDDRWFALYQNGWKVPAGDYFILASSSSQDTRLRGKIHLNSEDSIDIPAWQEKSWYAAPSQELTDADWEIMSGQKIPVSETKGKRKYTMDSSIDEMCRDSWIARKMKSGIENSIAKNFGLKAPDYSNENFRMMMASSTATPLRSMVISTGGRFPEWVAKLLLLHANL